MDINTICNDLLDAFKSAFFKEDFLDDARLKLLEIYTSLFFLYIVTKMKTTKNNAHQGRINLDWRYFHIYLLIFFSFSS